jgi:hypothetical protein
MKQQVSSINVSRPRLKLNKVVNKDPENHQKIIVTSFANDYDKVPRYKRLKS